MRVRHSLSSFLLVLVKHFEKTIINRFFSLTYQALRSWIKKSSFQRTRIFLVTRTEPTFPFGKIGGGGHLGTYIICQLWHQTRACPLQVGPLHKRALLKSRRSRVWNRSFTSAWNLALASMESTRSVAWNQDRRVREDPLRGMPYTGKP